MTAGLRFRLKRNEDKVIKSRLGLIRNTPAFFCFLFGFCRIQSAIIGLSECLAEELLVLSVFMQWEEKKEGTNSSWGGTGNASKAKDMCANFESGGLIISKIIFSRLCSLPQICLQIGPFYLEESKRPTFSLLLMT